VTTANTAQTAANAAVTTANTAQTTAGAAQTAANAAVTTANNAQATASTALGVAGAAQATATTAMSTTNAAQITATQAQNLGEKNAVQIQAMVNGQLGVCAVNGGALQCSVMGRTPASAQGQGAVAVGVAAKASGSGAMAYGQNATASYTGAIAIGQGATITAPTNPSDPNTSGAIAIGLGARANADPATAIGSQANAAGADSVALGYAATASGNNSVALGAGSTDGGQANVVSVGSPGNERRITNVAPGVNGTDAVNVNQLNATVGHLRNQIDATGAMAAAMSNIQLPPGYSKGLGVAVGHQGNQSALAIGFVATPRPNLLTRISASLANGNSSVGAGVTWGW
jgi:hypothetical protein